jgi:hypothetical protein
MSNTCETRREKNGEKQGENRTLTVEKTVTMIGYSDHKSPFPSARKLNIGTKTCIQLLQKEDDVCYCYDVFHTKKSHIRVPYPTYLTSCFSRLCSKKHAKSTYKSPLLVLFAYTSQIRQSPEYPYCTSSSLRFSSKTSIDSIQSSTRIKRHFRMCKQYLDVYVRCNCQVPGQILEKCDHAPWGTKAFDNPHGYCPNYKEHVMVHNATCGERRCVRKEEDKFQRHMREGESQRDYSYTWQVKTRVVAEGMAWMQRHPGQMPSERTFDRLLGRTR